MSEIPRAIAMISVFLASALSLAGPVTRPPFSPGKAAFSIKVRGEVIPYEVLALFPMPGEELEIELVERRRNSRYTLETPHETRPPDGRHGWSWTCPAEPGLYRLRIHEEASGGSILLNVFVRVPATRVRNGSLNGYRIGAYPDKPLKGLAIYRPPRGFVEVTPENVNVQVSPHFSLKQFLCKQEGGYPKYLVLKERLLLKLELLLARANDAGYRCDTFYVMSGYRTPFYNAAIGNVRYSRHVWGGAADIFIDEEPRDEMIDDLNRDGKNDYRDALVLYELVDDIYGEPSYEPFVGGLGNYKRTANHGPFVHVDVRGFRARWGT